MSVRRAAKNWSRSDAHAEVTAQLLGAIRTQLGEEVLDRLVESRAAEAKATYAAALQGSADLGERVARLAAARTPEGYMAEARPEGDGYLLVENHCPICVAAKACPGFCRTELDTFRAVLGPRVSVERTEHIIQGDPRCAYRVSLPCVPETRKRRDAGAARKGKSAKRRK